MLLIFMSMRRGALFFGPGFRVTRNKLTFRDNLALLLEAASPTDRQLEKHFKEWLAGCHRSYDRSVKFEVLCHSAAQVRDMLACQWMHRHASPSRFARGWLHPVVPCATCPWYSIYIWTLPIIVGLSPVFGLHLLLLLLLFTRRTPARSWART